MCATRSTMCLSLSGSSPVQTCYTVDIGLQQSSLAKPSLLFGPSKWMWHTCVHIVGYVHMLHVQVPMLTDSWLSMDTTPQHMTLTVIPQPLIQVSPLHKEHEGGEEQHGE